MTNLLLNLFWRNKRYLKVLIAYLAGSGMVLLIAGLLYAIDASNTINTVAGDGNGTFAGDGGQAKDASLNSPTDIAFDTDGNIIFADSLNHRVRMIDVSGVITTIAGTGDGDFSGDGGQAKNAKLHLPQGIAIDANGNILIADSENHRIRQIDVSGVITTIAGTGESGFDGDGGPAKAAKFNLPKDIAIDANGNIIIVDGSNHRVRMIDVSGVITTIAGTGTLGFSGDGGQAKNAQLHGPEGVMIDPDGNILIADTNNQRIRMIDVSGVITTIAGNGNTGTAGDGGQATDAQLNFPTDVAFDSDDNLIIADTAGHRIRMIDTSGVITKVAGNGAGFSGDSGPAGSSQLRFPTSVAIDNDDNLYIADTTNNRLRKITTPVFSEAFVIDPNSPLRQIIDTTDSLIHIEAGPDSLPKNSASLRYTPRNNPSTTDRNGLPTPTTFGPIFQLDILQGDGTIIANPTFTSPLEITVNLTDTIKEEPELEGVIYKVFFYDEAGNLWVSVPVSNQSGNQLKFEMQHFTEFALVADSSTIYLPVLMK